MGLEEGEEGEADGLKRGVGRPAHLGGHVEDRELDAAQDQLPRLHSKPYRQKGSVR